jgi:hypothetical protein
MTFSSVRSPGVSGYCPIGNVRAEYRSAVIRFASDTDNPCVFEFVFELLGRLVGDIFGWLWLDRETQRADLTAADFLVRISLAAGVFVLLIWLLVR